MKHKIKNIINMNAKELEKFIEKKRKQALKKCKDRLKYLWSI
jgi:hypothetical protein